jgi:hypothetical protein
MRGPNVLSFQLILGATRWYIVGCYIPPTNLTTLMHVDEAWRACPKGCHPILLGDLNVNLAAPRNERDDTIAVSLKLLGLISCENLWLLIARHSALQERVANDQVIRSLDD